MSENHHSRFYVASSDLQGLYALKIAYLFFSLVSLGLTVYVLLVWRVSLPSFDIIDYHEFLSSAANGVLLRDDLWVRHNGAHLIFLPRLVFFVDMWMGRGSGVITTLVSCAAILGTVYIFCRAVFRLDVVDKNEKLFFCLLIFFVMTSDIVLESLLNPVDIQWSLLALGSVLLAYGFGLCCEGVVGAGLGYVLVGSLVSYFSAGPLFLMLVAS